MAIVLAIAVHAALAAGLLAVHWAGWGIDVLLALVLAKIVAVILLGLCRRRSRHPRGRQR